MYLLSMFGQQSRATVTSYHVYYSHKTNTWPSCRLYLHLQVCLMQIVCVCVTCTQHSQCALHAGVSYIVYGLIRAS